MEGTLRDRQGHAGTAGDTEGSDVPSLRGDNSVSPSAPGDTGSGVSLPSPPGAARDPPGDAEPDGDKVCAVCGDRANGYHFHVLSCEGCKGFFRRSILKGVRFTCPLARRCAVTKAKRRQCQACRLQKCLDAGMRRDMIMSEEALRRRRELRGQRGQPGGQRGQPRGQRGQPGAGLRLLLLLGGLAALAAAQVTSEDQEVPEHKPVELRCAAFRSSSGSARIEWKFQRGSSLALIYYGGELTEPYRDRVQFSPTSIRFGSVTREDSGKYICEVVGDGSHIAKSEVNLIVQVPPGKPLAHVPSSATVGARAVLRCSEAQGSPPPTFRWYKDGTELPQDPKSSPAFRNSSYSLDPRTGELVFEPVGGWDTGDYHCEASNNVGSPQKSDVFRMEASEVNVGGIVAAVVLLLLVLGLAAFGVWFAHRRGYFSKKTDAGGKKVIYSQPSRRSESEFKQTSSFLV